MQLPSLKAVRAFEVVARLGVINKAAEELNLTPSAVSHQIANLEAFVGRELLDRTARGVRLTAAGERYLEGLAGALAVIAGAAENARQDSAEVLRIQAAPSFVSLWLFPRLPGFMAEFPQIGIRLSATHVYSDFVRGESDIDIRYGAVSGSDLHIESLFVEEVLPMITPALKARLDIRQPADLLTHSLILSSQNLVRWPRWFAAQGVSISPSHYALTFDRTYLSIQAAIRGLGITLESHRLAEETLSKGELVPVFDDRRGIAIHGHHVVFPRARLDQPKVAHFLDWVRREAQRPAASQ
ncbi:MAG: LysR substrate-binding domain-containing protein [Burkholderiaceae bacterium]